VFKIIDSDLTKTGKSIGLFNKEWRNVWNDLTNVKGLKNKISATFSNGLTQDDIIRLKEYNNLINKGKNAQFAYHQTLRHASSAAQNLAMNAQGAAVSEKSLTEATSKLSISQKVATVSTRVLGTALNIALNVGLAIAINAIISQVYKLVNAEKEAKQKAEELRQTAINNAEVLTDESQQLDSLISRYTEIISKTDNLSEAKEDLTNIQNELTDSHNLEADSLDLLNGKYAENIDLINKQKKAKAQEYADNADNSKAYREAKKRLESESTITESVDFEGNTSYIADKNAIRIKAKGMGNWGETTRQNWKDLGYDNINFLNNNFNEVYVTGTLEEQMKALEAIYKAYEKQIGNTANEVYLERLHLLQSEYNAVKKLYDDSTKIVSEYENNLNKIDELSVFDNEPWKKNQFDSLSQEVIDLGKAFSETNSTAEKLTISQKFEEIEDKLYSLVSGNNEYTEIVDGLFKNIEDNLAEFQNSVTSTADTYISSFNKYKEEDFETVTKQIKTFTDALDTLSDGEFLDSDTMWELVGINEELAGSFQKTANGYIIGSNKIISAKDDLIKKQIEYAESELKQNNSIISDLELQIQSHKKQRDEFAKSINSAEDTKYLKQYDTEIQFLEDKIKSVANTSEKWKLVLKQLNGSLGNTVSKAKQLEKQAEKLQNQIDKINDEINSLNDEIDKLQGYADELLEYQEAKIDNIIDNLEDEQKILEDEKFALEEQLETLENQKSQIEEQIKLYEDVVSTVTDAINDEKSLIEKEKNLIESEKEELQNQLDILEEKKQKTEETIQDYEKVYSIISDTVDKQIEAIEKERDATESYYDDMISKLQEQNSERERSIELAEKESALENAKKNKIRVYSEQKGWTWEDNTEEIRKAKNDLDSLKNQIKIGELEKQKEQSLKEYDEKISVIKKYAEQAVNGQNSYNDEQNLQESEKLLGMSREEIYEKISNQDSEFINQLNNTYYQIQESRDGEIQSEINFINQQINQKNKQSKIYDDMISEWGKYIDEWENTVKSYKKNQDKLIAEQKLGSDWLERVKQKDTSILNKFKSNYESYQTALNGTVSQEIADLQNSIAVKEQEIESKKNQISEWNDYKDQLSSYAASVSQTWSDYVKNLDTVVLDENSTFEQRQSNLETFKSNYRNLVDEIMSKQSEMSNLTYELEENQSRLNDIQNQINSVNFQQDSAVYDKINELHAHYQQEKERWDYYNGLGIRNAVDAENINEIASRMRGLREQLKELYSSLGIEYDAYAAGGVNTKTGFAWLDGTPDKPELVLNNNQAARLYNFLNGSGNIGKSLLDSIDVSVVRDRIGDSLKNIYNKASRINTVSKTPVYNINIYGNIVTDSAENFMKQMSEYIRLANIESMNR